MRPNPADLTGRARKAFDTYTGFFGLDEAAAMIAVESDGLLAPAAGGDAYDESVRFYQDVMGLDEAGARVAVRGRDGGSDDQVRAELNERAAGGAFPPGAEQTDQAFVALARELAPPGRLAEGVRRAVDADRRAGRVSPGWAVEMAAGPTVRSTSGGLSEARRQRRKPATVTRSESDRKPARRQRVDLVESDRFAEAVRFYQEVMGLDEAAATVAARGRDGTATNRNGPGDRLETLEDI